MTLTLIPETTPSAPASGSKHFTQSSDLREKTIRADGTISILADIGRHGRNYLVNSGFAIAQRQAPTTLTTYTSVGGRVYAGDYWCLTNESASVQWAIVSAKATPVAGITSEFYAQIKKITNTGKVIVSQVIESSDVMALRGRRVRVQIKARNNVGSHVLRLGVLQLTSAGTADTVPISAAAFATAFGAAGTDPTWGTNLTAITPTLANSAATISGNFLTCTLTGTFQKFSGVFTIPTTCLNLVFVLFTNGQPASTEIFEIAEAGIADGDEERDFLPLDAALEFQRCRRRCWTDFAPGTAPAASVGNATGGFRFTAVTAGATNLRSHRLNLPVQMLRIPTVTTLNTGAAGAEVRDVSGSLTCTGTTVTDASVDGFFIACSGNASTVAGATLAVHLFVEDLV